MTDENKPNQPEGQQNEAGAQQDPPATEQAGADMDTPGGDKPQTAPPAAEVGKAPIGSATVGSRMPEIGEHVLYKGGEYEPSVDANVTAVHSETCINLKVQGRDEEVTSVAKHVGEGDPRPRTWRFASGG